ncbi:Com family DNA-binding transcriptional regulator [Salinicola rhizosphaerae]|uniref:Com family DNA-binding transcriptional regulator n=1 Tax=Salinicola rhizosphaerae TaxID=1443141 RepID=UPI00227D898A|nr:Com family DNA-binding transcriptional regulator [Salinicola rhizosphaerae]
MAINEIRCGRCNRMLARASEFQLLEIKCPRCGHFHTQRATSPGPRRNPRGNTNHSLDGRQASSG